MNDSLVTLTSFIHEYEAELARSLLAEAGIDSYILDQQINSMHWGYALASGGLRLQVRKEDAERALDILGLHKKLPEKEASGVDIVCPKCQSKYVGPAPLSLFSNLKKLISVILALMIFTPVPYKNKGWQCKDCQHKWN